MGRNITKNISKTLIPKYSQKILDYDKYSETDTLKTTLKRVIQKTAKPTRYLISNKIIGKITKVLRTSPQNNLETDTNEEESNGLDKEILRERYIYLQK